MKGGFPTTRGGLISSRCVGLRRPARRVRALESGRVSPISLSLIWLGWAAKDLVRVSTCVSSAWLGAQLVRPCSLPSWLGWTTAEEVLGFPNRAPRGRFPASSDINNNISQRQRTHNTNQHTTMNTNYNTYWNITVLLLLLYGQGIRVKGESRQGRRA